MKKLLIGLMLLSSCAKEVKKDEYLLVQVEINDPDTVRSFVTLNQKDSFKFYLQKGIDLCKKGGTIRSWTFNTNNYSEHRVLPNSKLFDKNDLKVVRNRYFRISYSGNTKSSQFATGTFIINSYDYPCMKELRAQIIKNRSELIKSDVVVLSVEEMSKEEVECFLK